MNTYTVCSGKMFECKALHSNIVAVVSKIILQRNLTNDHQLKRGVTETGELRHTHLRWLPGKGVAFVSIGGMLNDGPLRKQNKPACGVRKKLQSSCDPQKYLTDPT